MNSVRGIDLLPWQLARELLLIKRLILFGCSFWTIIRISSEESSKVCPRVDCLLFCEFLLTSHSPARGMCEYVNVKPAKWLVRLKYALCKPSE